MVGVNTVVQASCDLGRDLGLEAADVPLEVGRSEGDGVVKSAGGFSSGRKTKENEGNTGCKLFDV